MKLTTVSIRGTRAGNEGDKKKRTHESDLDKAAYLITLKWQLLIYAEKADDSYLLSRFLSMRRRRRAKMTSVQYCMLRTREAT